MRVEIRHEERELGRWARKVSQTDLALIKRKVEMLRQHGLTGLPLIRRLEARLYELRVGKYRLYFTVQDDRAYFLAYGDKDSQPRDISEHGSACNGHRPNAIHQP